MCPSALKLLVAWGAEQLVSAPLAVLEVAASAEMVVLEVEVVVV